MDAPPGPVAEILGDRPAGSVMGQRAGICLSPAWATCGIAAYDAATQLFGLIQPGQGRTLGKLWLCPGR